MHSVLCTTYVYRVHVNLSCGCGLEINLKTHHVEAQVIVEEGRDWVRQVMIECMQGVCSSFSRLISSAR